MLYVWYPKNRTDLHTIHKENDVIEMEELARVKAEHVKSFQHCQSLQTDEHLERHINSQ